MTIAYAMIKDKKHPLTLKGVFMFNEDKLDVFYNI